MKTLLEVLDLATDFLYKKGIVNARRQTQDLFSDALGLSRMELYLHHDRPLNESELDRLRKRVARRGSGEPLAYIHGEVKFFNCALEVNSDVLIPRQETEILVDRIAAELQKEELQGRVLWDICCGSGCIGISLKKHLPSLHVILSDICPKALKVAKTNAVKNEVEVQFVQGNFLEPFAGMKADYIVCNPPYVTEEAFQHLDPEVKLYEPRQALVAAKQGLEFYERLAQETTFLLNKQAKLWFELGAGQGPALMNLFEGYPWKSRRVEQDWAGHDRFFFLEIE